MFETSHNSVAESFLSVIITMQYFSREIQEIKFSLSWYNLDSGNFFSGVETNVLIILDLLKIFVCATVFKLTKKDIYLYSWIVLIFIENWRNKIIVLFLFQFSQCFITLTTNHLLVYASMEIFRYLIYFILFTIL